MTEPSPEDVERVARALGANMPPARRAKRKREESISEWTAGELALLQGFIERMYEAATSLRRHPDAPAQNREYHDQKLRACCALVSAMVNA